MFGMEIKKKKKKRKKNSKKENKVSRHVNLKLKKSTRFYFLFYF